MLRFLKRGLRPRAHAEDRLGRLRKVLDRANVNYTRDTPEAALNRMPVTCPPAGRPRLQTQKFRFPLVMPARIAMLEGGFPLDGAMRQFAAGEFALLPAYVPEALVMPLQIALTLADQKQRGLLQLPTLTSAVVIFTSLADTPLEDHHRELLWHAFNVPLFEQLRGWDGAILARECEVHDGLHIDEAAVILQKDHTGELIATQLTAFDDPIVRVLTGWTGEIVTEHCECGAETPRLRNLARFHAGRRLAVAGQ